VFVIKCEAAQYPPVGGKLAESTAYPEGCIIVGLIAAKDPKAIIISFAEVVVNAPVEYERAVTV
jgi:hypothetical protein